MRYLADFRLKIEEHDYEALVALGYPPAEGWFPSAVTGEPFLLCPFTGKSVSVALLVRPCARHRQIIQLNGDRCDLTRGNIRVITKRSGGYQTRAHRSLTAAFEKAGLTR